MAAKTKARAKSTKTLPKPKKMGRPSDFTPRLVAEICRRMAAGETLTDICNEDGMPSRNAVWEWRQARPDFDDAFVRAREEQMNAWADQIISISDDGRRDYVDSDGKKLVDHDHILRAKLRVDTRKFLMAKIAPRLYGDKVALEHTGKDGAPLAPVINVTIGGTEPSSAS